MTTNVSSIYNRQFVPGAVPIEGESQELVDILQKIVRNAGALLEVGNCSVALLDAKGTTLVTLAALQQQGREPRHTRFRLNEGVAGWVAEHREPLVIPDVSLDPRFKRLGCTPIGSMVCVPLIDNGIFIGTLTASSPETDAFSERKLEMLTIFAEQAVLAIMQARHAEVAERQANQLEMLLDLSRGITTRLDAHTLYRTILADVRHLVPCESVMMYQYHEQTQELCPVAAWSGSASPLLAEQEDVLADVQMTHLQHEKISLHDANSVTAWAAVHRHPMLRAPLRHTHEKEGAPPAAHLAEQAAPLISKPVIYGALTLQRSEPFTSEELRLVRNLSNMAAAALENVELFQLVRTDQEQLRAILASSSDGIAIIGINGCFVEANASFGRIFGLDPQQVVGMECMELFECDEENAHEECKNLYMVHRALQQQEPLPYIEIDVKVQGVSRSIGMSITPVTTASKPLCLVMARDVTAIRDATRLKANFLSMITHELRSPLNAIHGYLDLALTGIAGELNEQQREFVQRARASSEHLYALVEDLLLISRADSGQMRLSREITSLQDIIANAIEELELMAADNEVTISVTIAGDFPCIYADAVRIQQVLRNLISNALRFTPSGGSVTVSANVTCRTAPGDAIEYDDESKLLLLQVSDTGQGIAPEFQQRIFERFFQVPQASARVTGQGLGLAIVRMIIELHGGTVSVESEPGKGSTFSCLIPCMLS